MKKTIACHGSAHTNAHQDHCGVCLGSPAGWGRLPAPRAPRAPRPRNIAIAAVKAAINESIETGRTVKVRVPAALVPAALVPAALDEVDAWGLLDGKEWRLRLLAYE